MPCCSLFVAVYLNQLFFRFLHFLKESKLILLILMHQEQDMLCLIQLTLGKGAVLSLFKMELVLQKLYSISGFYLLPFSCSVRPRAARYIPVQQLTGTWTACYRAVILLPREETEHLPVWGERSRRHTLCFSLETKQLRDSLQKEIHKMGVKRERGDASSHRAGTRQHLVSPLGEKGERGSRRKFARRFAEGIGKLAGNAKGDRREEDRRICRKIVGVCVVGTRTARYRAVPPKIDRRRSIEREKGKKKKRREEERIPSARASSLPARCRHPRVASARAPSPPAGRQRVAGAFSPARGERSRRHGTEVWEIDFQQLNFGNKVASGSHGDLLCTKCGFMDPICVDFYLGLAHVCKICIGGEGPVDSLLNFGVARVKAESGVMTAETGTYRWMAPELEASNQDNTPKLHLSDKGNTCGSFSFYSLQGLRPTIPKNAHPKLAELMENCWQQNPTDRPDFSEILHILQLIAKEVFHQTLNLCAQISYFSLKKSFWLIGFELSNRWEKNPTIGSWNIHQVGFSPFLDRGR
ncbi:hypothetical protein GW17_00011494 [Ensete ventricosum]|nr:hypothetical protein GW17_00011494 [Ensete ventricosum]